MRRSIAPAGWLHLLLLVSLLAGLAAHIYNGSFSRFIADDFCLAADAYRMGALEATIWRYYAWTGRFVQFYVQGSLAALGPGFASLLPALIVVSWLAAATWLLYEIDPFITRLQRPILACLLLAAMIVLASVDGLFSTIQSVYWISGSLGYTVPLIVLTALLAFLASRVKRAPESQPSVRAPLLVMSIAFVNGGLSESYTVFQIAVFVLLGTLAFPILPRPRRRATFLLLGAGMVGSLLALAIMLAAPGNAARQAAMSASPLIHPPLPILLVESLKVGFISMASGIGLFSPVQLLATLVVSALLCYQLRPAKLPFALYPRRVRRWMGLSALIAFALNVVIMAPSIYASGRAPSERIYVIPQYVVAATAAFWGALMGLSVRKGPRLAREERPGLLTLTGRALLAALVLLGPVAITLSNVAKSPQFRTFAAEWDARDRQLRAAAERGVEVVPAEPLSIDLARLSNLETAGPDPTHWINGCMARYYGIRALIVQPTATSGDRADA